MEDTSRWPTKFDLVKTLGISERTIERKIAAGEIRRLLRNVPGRKPISVIHPDDAVKLKTETLEAIPVEKQGLATVPPQSDMTAFIENVADALVAAFTKLPQFQVPTVPTATPTKLWLSPKEATAYSGLPWPFIREKCDCFARKKKWYVSRTSLEQVSAP